MASWNMGHWRYKLRNTWEYLQNIIDADVALVQEAQPEELGIKNIVWKPIGKTRPWGSGVFSKSFELMEVNFKNCFPGAISIADVKLSDTYLLTCISIYGLLDEFGSSLPNLHKMLSDITYLLNGKLGKKNIVIGGDFNASLLHDSIRGKQSSQIFFQRLQDFGFIDGLKLFNESPVQTLRHNLSSKPWQIDNIFVSENLSKSILSVRVINCSEIIEYSDHNPISIVFDI